MIKRLNITNGSSAVELMKVAVIEGDKMSWDDVLHEGPVKNGLTLSQQSALRSEFISGAGWVSAEMVQAKFKQRDEEFSRAAEYDEIWLWFEHDLYDQLQLIQILDQFRQTANLSSAVFLINPGKHLGYHSPEEFANLVSIKKKVTSSQLELASSAWDAFTADNPERLSRLISTELNHLEFLKPALIRLCQEYPNATTGLPLTERLILDCLLVGSDSDSNSSQELNPGALFSDYQSREAAAFMGDSTFFLRLNSMTRSDRPLIKFAINEAITYPINPQQKVSITKHGLMALAGNYDWFFESDQSKFIGGCLVSASQPKRWHQATLTIK